MHIAFDTYNLSSSGGSGNRTYTVELIRALNELSTADDWHLLTYWRKKDACTAVFRKYKQCIIKNYIPNPHLLGNHLAWPVKKLTSFTLQALARGYDLFHCTNPAHFPFSLPVVATTICDLIALRDEPWTTPNSRSYYKKHLTAIVNRSRCLFAISAFTKAEILNRYPSAEGRIIVTPLAANARFISVPKDRSFLSRFNIADTQRPYLLTVGDLQPRKNIIGILRAFESLSGESAEVNLVVIGRTKGALSNEIIRELSSSPKRDRIHLVHTATDDDLVLFYNHALGFIFYSFFEGFGLPVIEAMQCGCPVAAADSSSLTEIAKDAALLVDPYNHESMRNGMVQLIENDSLRDELRKKGFDRAARYSWKTTAELTYSGYKKVLGID